MASWSGVSMGAFVRVHAESNAGQTSPTQFPILTMPDSTADLPPDAPRDAPRDDRILADLQDAVSRMHVVAQRPRLVVARGTRTQGARAMAWQVLFERSFGGELRALRYRGVSARALSAILANGFDSEPTLDPDWSQARLGAAMAHGPVIQAFRADRLPDDVATALVGLLVFEEDGLHIDGVRAVAGEFGIR